LNLNNPKALLENYPAIKSWLIFLVVFWLFSFIGLGWVVKLSLILLGVILITPVALFLGLQWWLKRSLVQDQCPVCNFDLVGLNNRQLQCPNCGENLQVSDRHFQRLTPPGTIDVQAVEVSAQVVDD
jgi:predicted RNA-binding Zn-ribbon protein involved in translation (DUF1610 family)